MTDHTTGSTTADWQRLVAHQAVRILDLEVELSGARTLINTQAETAAEYLGYFGAIEKALNYVGHPGNLAGVIKAKA